MTTINKTSFEATNLNELAIASNINKVIERFNSGATIIVFKGNHTIVMSSKVHTEATLMHHLNGATTVRICAK